MAKGISSKHWDAAASSERMALRAIAAFFDQIPNHVCLSDQDVALRLHEVGLSGSQADIVLQLRKLRGPCLHVDIDDGVFAPPDTCPIGWRPTVLTPVFWGRQIYEPNNCLPVLTRVYYPTLDGSPQNAAMLSLCGKYPVVLFLHGHCPAEDNHVFRWERHLAQLARSGFVVVAPYLSSIGAGPQSEATLNDAVRVLRWVRKEWAGRANLLPSTGVFGHSYGAMVACQLAATHSVACFAGLNAGWHEWGGFGTLPMPLFSLKVPSLHIWGTEGISDSIQDNAFAQIATPRHKVILNGGDHWVYLSGQSGGCSPAPSNCHLLGAIAGDLLAGFFARYMPPSEFVETGATIPRSLVPPEIDLTFEQLFYTGAHLRGLKGLQFAERSCHVTSAWTTASDSNQLDLRGSMN